ncbi:3-oxoacyl-[acyl-carrier-protein] synthase I, chloroplastic [Capsicum baccatum]|uniref:3-oxoacyl-[acyl-carrier-protein] synthase I, chloroplastic n=1 Tax=Capsicum baccatum TaxID=33114 RepID=A0A2G2WCW3_CAPBA|nr:3-oxoacyl-[acyl-carrier-protein] synthase I, chloroplastic [Capsicum baccatum]
MASSTVSSWLIGSCMSVVEHEIDGFFGISKSKCKRAAAVAPTRRRRRVFLNTKSDNVLTHFSSSNSSLFVDNYSSFLFCGSEMSRRTKHISSAHTGEVMAIASQPAMEVSLKKKPPTKERRVVVTGMGVATPIGHDPHEFYENLLQGVSGISEIEAFDCSQYPTRIAGEIKSFSTDGWIVPKLSKRMDKFMLYMLMAGKKALSDGGITDDMMDELDKRRCGVLIGSAMGGMKVFNDAIEALRVSYRKMNPFCVPFATTNMGSAMLAMDLGWMGPNYSISTACATSNFCILNAANHIIRGEADMMLCGGSDAAIIPIGLGGFVACRALSQRNTDPARASRPWDSNRDGFVMGEGAGVLLLEELEHAKQRGATIYAEFLGGSFTCDAYHMTEPHPKGTGVILCVEKALAQSGVSKKDVNYINAHATSTPAGDLKEYQALLHCFGQNPELRVNSTKSMIGHLLGAAGAVEAVATIQAIRTGWAHPNINLETPDEGVVRIFLLCIVNNFLFMIRIYLLVPKRNGWMLRLHCLIHLDLVATTHQSYLLLTSRSLGQY